MKINRTSCEQGKEYTFTSGFARKLILPGEITGIETFFVKLRGGNAHKYLPEEKKIRIILVTNGSGNILQNDLSFPVHELALFIPDMYREFSIAGEKKSLSFLEIVMYLTEKDLFYLTRQQDKFPFFTSYSECRKYNESIKSEKTISRMILSENIMPRLCIGSVETSGPDEIAAHAHPMLEQLFFGLPGNDSIVMADTAKARFLEFDLLHIPLGSRHSVTVEAGKYLHYIWIDLFHNREDMDYIKKQHIMKEE